MKKALPDGIVSFAVVTVCLVAIVAAAYFLFITLPAWTSHNNESKLTAHSVTLPVPTGCKLGTTKWYSANESLQKTVLEQTYDCTGSGQTFDSVTKQIEGAGYKLDAPNETVNLTHATADFTDTYTLTFGISGTTINSLPADQAAETPLVSIRRDAMLPN